MAERSLAFEGFTPYLHCSDLIAMIEWRTRKFGFVEKVRWVVHVDTVARKSCAVPASALQLRG